MRRAAVLLATVLAAAVSGCGGSDSESDVSPPLRAVEPVVRMSTVVGDIDVRLFAEAAPNSVANFLRYAARGDYDGSYFHRVVMGYIAQGGGFRFAGERSSSIDEVVVDVDQRVRANDYGTLGVARVADEPDRATAQWYFNLVDNAPLNKGNNTVFGEVGDANSLEVVNRVGALPTTDATAEDPLSAFGALPVLPDWDDLPFERDEAVLVRSIRVSPDVEDPEPYTLTPEQITTQRGRGTAVTVSGVPAGGYVVARLGERLAVAVTTGEDMVLALRRTRARTLEVYALPPGVESSSATLELR